MTELVMLGRWWEMVIFGILGFQVIPIIRSYLLWRLLYIKFKKWRCDCKDRMVWKDSKDGFSWSSLF